MRPGRPRRNFPPEHPASGFETCERQRMIGWNLGRLDPGQVRRILDFVAIPPNLGRGGLERCSDILLERSWRPTRRCAYI